MHAHLRRVLALGLSALLSSCSAPPGATPSPPASDTPWPAATAPAGLPADCPHTPLGGFYDVWSNSQVWPRLGCAMEPAAPAEGTEAELCCDVHSLWIRSMGQFVVLQSLDSRWSFVPDGSGLPSDAVHVTPTQQPFTPTPEPPVTAVPTPTAQLGRDSTPTPTPYAAAEPSPRAAAALPTVILMTRTHWSPSEPCFAASGRHGWLSLQSPWGEMCQGRSRSDESVWSGALQRFEGGWLFWNGKVCFVLFADGTWLMF